MKHMRCNLNTHDLPRAAAGRCGHRPRVKPVPRLLPADRSFKGSSACPAHCWVEGHWVRSGLSQSGGKGHIFVQVILRLPKSPSVHKSKTKNAAVHGGVESKTVVCERAHEAAKCHCPCGVRTPGASPANGPACTPCIARNSGALSPGDRNPRNLGSWPLRQEPARISSLGRGWLVKEDEISLANRPRHK